MLGEKLHTLYEKIVEYDRITEDIVKHVWSADKITGYYDKVSFKPIEQILTELVKKFEVNHCSDFLVHSIGTIPMYNKYIVFINLVYF